MRKSFFEVTDNSNKLSSCFHPDLSFEIQSKKFLKTLNQTFHQCFRKIRITNKSDKKNQPTEEVQSLLDLKARIQTVLKCAKSDTAKDILMRKQEDVEKQISKLTAAKNASLMKEQIGTFLSSEGKFSQTGMWRLKSKLLPRKIDPPMAKQDEQGNLITAPAALRNLYTRTYVERLRHREIKSNLNSNYLKKVELWEMRFNYLETRMTCDWSKEL